MRMDDKDVCTLLVNSCDAYKDLWDPFFQLLNSNWPHCPYPVVLNTESEEYSCRYLQVSICHAESSAEPWGKRLYNCVKKIQTPYIIFLLDDFFLEAPVDTGKISQCIEWMEQDHNIATFSFVPTLWEDIDDKKYPGFLRRPFRCNYKVNCQAAVWRRDCLLKLIRKHETPWEFEVFGSSRARKYRDWTFYAANKSGNCAFQYPFGGVLHGGKWTPLAVNSMISREIAVNYEVHGIQVNPTIPKQITREEEKRMPQLTVIEKLVKFIKHWKSYI